MKTGDLVVLRRELRTPIGWFTRGMVVSVMVVERGMVTVCLDLDHHPGNLCHAMRLLRKDVAMP